MPTIQISAQRGDDKHGVQIQSGADIGSDDVRVFFNVAEGTERAEVYKLLQLIQEVIVQSDPWPPAV